MLIDPLLVTSMAQNIIGIMSCQDYIRQHHTYADGDLLDPTTRTNTRSIVLSDNDVG